MRLKRLIGKALSNIIPIATLGMLKLKKNSKRFQKPTKSSATRRKDRSMINMGPMLCAEEAWVKGLTAQADFLQWKKLCAPLWVPLAEAVWAQAATRSSIHSSG